MLTLFNTPPALMPVAPQTTFHHSPHSSGRAENLLPRLILFALTFKPLLEFRQALLDIVSEHLQFDRPTGQTEDEQPRQNQNNQDKSAEYFKNYK